MADESGMRWVKDRMERMHEGVPEAQRRGLVRLYEQALEGDEPPETEQELAAKAKLPEQAVREVREELERRRRRVEERRTRDGGR